MNELVMVIIIMVVVITLFMYYETKHNELTYVESNIDNKKYLVRNREDKQDAANLLAKIKHNLKKLCDYCYENDKDNEGIIRLMNKYNPDRISESIPGSKYTSYSVNKGEKIVLCIRSKKDEEQLMDVNTMMFVSIHELAHIMTKSIGHTEEFWNNMRFLLKRAIDIGVYRQQDYKKYPVKYCGIKITDTPLK